MDALELAAQVAVTEGFIATRPETIVLTPVEVTGDGSGGELRTHGLPRPPQQMRLVESGNGDLRPTEVGEQWVQEAVLLGMPDAAIEVNDEFPYDGSVWRVQQVMFPNGYEVRAVVLRYGR